MNRDEAIALVRASRLRSHADAIVASLQDSVRLYRDPADIADLPLGTSRFGGPPDLPRDLPWPSWEVEVRRGVFRRIGEKDENRLDCLAQIDLADLPDTVPAECPRQGMLWVFFDTYEQPWDVRAGEHGGAQVIYAPEPRDLVRTSPPPERGEHTPSPCRIRMAAEVTLPQRVDLFQDAADQDDYLENLAHPINEGEVVHRMFGHPQPIQEEEGIWGRGDQVLLLQIDSDNHRDGSPGWMWGDGGRLYFTMSRRALARREFAKVRMTLQCY